MPFIQFTLCHLHSWAPSSVTAECNKHVCSTVVTNDPCIGDRRPGFQDRTGHTQRWEGRQHGTPTYCLHVVYDQKWPQCTVPTMQILSCHSKSNSFTKCLKHRATPQFWQPIRAGENVSWMRPKAIAKGKSWLFAIGLKTRSFGSKSAQKVWKWRLRTLPRNINCLLSADHGNVDADVECKLRRRCSVFVLPEAKSTDVDKFYGFQVLFIVVKDNFGTHKWLGCMLVALGFGNADADITYHLQAAARAVYSNKWILLDTNVSIHWTINGGSNAWCNGSLTVVDGVVGQPTYGTLSSQTSADGKAFNIGLESRNHQSWMAMFPDFLHFVNL